MVEIPYVPNHQFPLLLLQILPFSSFSRILSIRVSRYAECDIIPYILVRLSVFTHRLFLLRDARRKLWMG